MNKLKNFLAGLLIGLTLLAGPTLLFTGCALFKNAPAAAVRYYTFLDSWTLSKAAYDAWSERVVSGQVSKEKEQAVDKAWNAYRAAFLLALKASSTDWNTAPPATVFALQEDLLKLIKLLQ